MASTVTVFETSARRTVIKVTPAKYLHEIRTEACEKFKLNADKYGLKHNNKNLDLSTPLRHAGLAAGAKLELTLLSRSAGVVTVALQLPEAEATGVPNGRLIDKFPSTTTLWQILRKFEDGVAGTTAKRNWTARGSPKTSDGASGAGRLYYEQPVLVIMHKEYSAFVDLQKPLSALGLNSGNVVIKLGFKSSDQPFEEAQQQIGQYFQEVEGSERELADSRSQGAQAPAQTEAAVTGSSTVVLEEKTNLTQPVESAMNTQAEPAMDGRENISPVPLPAPIEGVTDRPTTVYSAPTNSTPKAAAVAATDSDFEYTVEHAQMQNSLYKAAGRNRTLPSDAEIENKKKEAAEKVAAVQSVRIRTRFPDNTQAEAGFNQDDTGRALYAHVRSLLNHEDAPFTLRYRGTKGMSDLLEDEKKLIRDRGLTGNAVVFLIWRDEAGPEMRKAPVLKAQVTALARQVEVPIAEASGSSSKSDPVPGKPEKPERKGGMPAWLKKTLPGAKK